MPAVSVQIPDLLVNGRWIPGDEIDAIARGFHRVVRQRATDDTRPVAAVLPATAEGIALFLAATSLPVPIVLLEPDPASWQSDPPMPAGTLVVIPPSLASLGTVAAERGFDPLVLAEDTPRRGAQPLQLLSAPRIVTFTSGSTGAPKPVTRRLASVLGHTRARLSALGLTRGDGVIAGTSICRGNGLTRLLSALMLEGPFAVLHPRDHRAALSTLARSEFEMWGATAHYVDVLGRCVLTGPARAPRVCLVTSAISEPVFRRFRERFGVPLRQNYSSSETGAMAVDSSPADDVQPDSVGRPLPEVDLRIGDRPDQESPAGNAGTVWVRTPWLMEGYGFPPALTRPDTIDGWFRTRDLGVLSPDGRLRLVGRVDDCIRTREGQLVNLFAVAAGLRTLDGVREVEVVPLTTSAGASFGAVLECEPHTDVSTIRRLVAEAMPPWSWPRRLEVVSSLPRIATGKIDRRACRAMLGTESAS